MEDLFGNPVAPPVSQVNKKGRYRAKPKPKTNPLINVFGPGPAGAKCISCRHQYFREFASKYSKCRVRGDTGSASSDHNSRYQACGKYEPKAK